MKSQFSKIIVLIAITLVVLSSCQEKKITIDDLEEKDGIFYLKSDNSPFTGEISESYDNESPKIKFSLDSGLYVKTYEEWYENGEKKRFVEYENGRLKEESLVEWFDDGSEKLTEKIAKDILASLSGKHGLVNTLIKEGTGIEKILSSDELDYYQRLSEGYASFNITGTRSAFFGKVYRYDFNIFSEVSDMITGEKDGKTIVKAAEYIFDEYIGVFQEKGSLTAEIEYIVKYEETPFFPPRTQYSWYDVQRKLNQDGVMIVDESGFEKPYVNMKQRRKLKVRKYEGNGWKAYN